MPSQLFGTLHTPKYIRGAEANTNGVVILVVIGICKHCPLENDNINFPECVVNSSCTCPAVDAVDAWSNASLKSFFGVNATANLADAYYKHIY